MPISRKKMLWIALVAAAALLPAQIAKAQQSWPTGKVISYVVSYPPGGTTDVLARLIVQKIAPALGATIIVENKPGATGVIGGDFVARSAPDGFTLLGSSIGPMAILKSLNPKLPYDPVGSFEQVVMVGTIPSVLVVAGSSPYQNVADLIQAAKARPGDLSYASGGNGTILHISGELLKLRAGIDLVHVPYKGDTPAIQDVLGGHVSAMFAPVAPVLEHIRAGRLRALAVASSGRIDSLPNIPTTSEAGLRDAEAEQWQAVFTPKGTPRAIVDRLNAEIVAAIKDPEVAAKLQALGVTAKTGTPDELRRFQEADIEKWARVIRSAGIRLE
jgi:tripartite-type tricarboxylate transporter receptor subunit TctC